MHRYRRPSINFVTILFILLFVYTAYKKLSGLDAFTHVLHRYPLLSSNPILFAIAIPLVEIVIAGLLFFPWSNMAGLYASGGLLAIYGLYTTIVYFTVPHLPCSCGGIVSELSWPQHIIADFSCACIAFALAFIQRRETKHAVAVKSLS